MTGSDTRPLYVAKRTTLIISNDEMNDIMKIVKSLEESCLLEKGVSKTIKNESKEQKGGFLSLGNLLTGQGTIRAGEDTVRVSQDF